ncbi:MAG: hypothetical protein GY894_06270 [Planctomycetes bacterium]|jgi:hypothetical protein|nr:hypothetical protein [Planctomycetota bacterium]MCP4838950.1 hypothetical protein [Planctomycetota bacterium]
MNHPIPKGVDAVAQARMALRQMELAIRRARFDRKDVPTPPGEGKARPLSSPPKLRRTG